MTETSVIGPSTLVRGNVRGAANLEIHGSIEGDVEVTGDVLLAEGSSVRGNVTGANVTVYGTVQGELRGSEAVFIEAGAKVLGDLSAPRVGITSGALVRGNVRTEGEAPLQGARRGATTTTMFRGTAPGLQRHPAHAAPGHAAALPHPAKIERIRVADMERRLDDEEDDEETASIRTDAARGLPGTTARRPPPPVVPVLTKGAKAKKKKRE